MLARQQTLDARLAPGTRFRNFAAISNSTFHSHRGSAWRSRMIPHRVNRYRSRELANSSRTPAAPELAFRATSNIRPATASPGAHLGRESRTAHAGIERRKIRRQRFKRSVVSDRLPERMIPGAPAAQRIDIRESSARPLVRSRQRSPRRAPPVALIITASRPESRCHRRGFFSKTAG